MKANCYLIVEMDTDQYNRPRLGTVRVNKKYPEFIGSREIAFQLALDIPDVFFKRLVPTVNIQVPEDMLVNPDPEIVVSLTAGKVAEALKLDVKTVEDGLAKMLQEQNERVS